MNKPTTALALAAALAAANAGANTTYTWNGTADNPVWDTTTANWTVGGAAATWVNNASSSSGSNPSLGAGGATDITVDAAGVEGYEFDSVGTHTLSGGPVTMHVFDMNNGNLTIYNRFTCTDTGDYAGFRMYGGTGTVTVGDGGYLDAYFSPFDNASSAGRLVILTNGTFRATFKSANLKNSNKPTIYFNGGTLIPANTSSITTFGGSTKLVIGAGGMRVAPRESGWSYLPGPIGTDTELATDGGLIIGDLNNYLYVKNVASTFRGGIHLAGTGGAVGVESNQTLGQTPAVPTDNIFFECPSNTVSSKLVSHGSVTLNANRNIRIGNGVTAQLSGYNSGSRLTVKGAISCDNPEHGHLSTVAYDSSSLGPVTLDPGAGRTNRISRLFAQLPGRHRWRTQFRQHAERNNLECEGRRTCGVERRGLPLPPRAHQRRGQRRRRHQVGNGHLRPLQHGQHLQRPGHRHAGRVPPGRGGRHPGDRHGTRRRRG